MHTTILCSVHCSYLFFFSFIPFVLIAAPTARTNSLFVVKHSPISYYAQWVTHTIVQRHESYIRVEAATFIRSCTSSSSSSAYPGAATFIRSCTMTIKSFSVDYLRNNEQGIFSSGDTITGRISLVALKETTLQSLCVKVKGKAEVKWMELDGQNTVVCSDKKKYFGLRKVLREGKGDGSEIITPGRHVYPFTFQIPAKEMPSSYVGKCGKITYSLKAKLIRTLWLIDKAKTEFPFLSKADIIIPGLRVKYSFYLFSVSIEVLIEIHNNSTRTVTPNFSLYEKQSFFAKHKRKVYTHDIITAIGDPVPAATRQTATKVLTVPSQLSVSFLDCSILNLEYMLKVSLDIPMAKDPEVNLLVVILLDKSKAAEERLQEYSWSK
uniref:Arrestin C-terminal-like domain-containing protein n=1 Tax=Esox lucius TaxID=8010 RepID=A0A3P8YLG5_ESOLU